MGKGAFYTEEYPNCFESIGICRQEAEERVRKCFQTIFFDAQEKFYHDVEEDSGCMEDTGNNDARTEGMSYGMMMCVQMDQKALFDKLWCFSKRYMYLESGKHAGYFAWSVQLGGKHNAEGPAPDGEEYYAMATLSAPFFNESHFYVHNLPKKPKKGRIKICWTINEGGSEIEHPLYALPWCLLIGPC